jgi:hypothetical protein
MIQFLVSVGVAMIPILILSGIAVAINYLVEQSKAKKLEEKQKPVHQPRGLNIG